MIWIKTDKKSVISCKSVSVIGSPYMVADRQKPCRAVTRSAKSEEGSEAGTICPSIKASMLSPSSLQISYRLLTLAFMIPRDRRVASVLFGMPIDAAKDFKLPYLATISSLRIDSIFIFISLEVFKRLIIEKR